MQDIVNLQRFVQLYGAVCTPMKQQNVVVDRVEHRLFHSTRKRQSQETGSYTVTISLDTKLSILSICNKYDELCLWSCLICTCRCTVLSTVSKLSC